MELSAFAHMTRRNIKVIQPGLVYVIEWRAGGEPSASSSSQPSSSAPQSESRTVIQHDGTPASPRRSKRTPSVTSPQKRRPEGSTEKHRTGRGYYVYEEVTSDEEDGDDGNAGSQPSVKKEEEEVGMPGASKEEDAGPTIYVA